MPLTRRKWNNVIIIACLMMVSVLMVLEQNRTQTLEDVTPLFGIEFPLSQLQLNDLWMHKGQSKWLCSEMILNCQQWANAWQDIQISALTTEPDVFSTPQKLVLQIAKMPTTQVWTYYQQQGLLKSPANNWYQVPPSLRYALKPIINVANEKNK